VQQVICPILVCKKFLDFLEGPLIAAEQANWRSCPNDPSADKSNSCCTQEEIILHIDLFFLTDLRRVTEEINMPIYRIDKGYEPYLSPLVYFDPANSNENLSPFRIKAHSHRCAEE
jgi:hypothetical protein